MVQKFREYLKISFKVNFRDKNFVITLNFRDSTLPHPFFSEHATSWPPAATCLRYEIRSKDASKFSWHPG